MVTEKTSDLTNFSGDFASKCLSGTTICKKHSCPNLCLYPVLLLAQPSVKVRDHVVLPKRGVPVAMIALVGANEILPDGGLRALATIAGETILERQALRLADVGVTHMALVVGTVTAELLDACDRIQRRGTKVTPVRSAQDLSALVSEDERVILVTDGLRAGSTHYAAIAKPGAPAILVTGDTPLTQGFERIDATRRWGGLATISSGMVAELAAMPGEWDMVLTLLRMAVQAGSRRLYCEPALFERGEIAIITDRPTAQLIEQVSLQQVEFGGMGLGRSTIMMPLVRLAGPLLVRSPVAAIYLPYITGFFWLTAALLTAGGLAAAGTIVALLGGLSLAAWQFTASFRADSLVQDRARGAMHMVSLGLIACYPWLLAATASATKVPSFSEAALAPCLAGALFLARTLFEDGAERRRFHWLLPDTDQIWLMMLPAALFGFLPLLFAIMPLLAIFQILLWVRMARRPNVT
ncbi:MAG TPA: hypothetical protein VFG34_00805 [Sphingopyxis sp.]|nr:hypothetical protein [Sphingopyxis sp.]